MLEPLEDRNLTEIRPLPPPKKIKRTTPITPQAALTVATARREIRDILHGRDAKRLLAIVGPCSIHDADEALEYATRLRRAAEPLRGELCVVMRTYFEKPRTTIGWKGLINDPHLDGSGDVNTGLRVARELLRQVLKLVPAFGLNWLVSGLYAAVGTAALGMAAREYWAHGGLGSPRQWKRTANRFRSQLWKRLRSLKILRRLRSRKQAAELLEETFEGQIEHAVSSQ